MYQLTKVRLVAAVTNLPEDYLRLRLRYQLVATATYLPTGYLVAAATYLRLRLRCQLVAIATYLRLRLRFTKPRYQLVASSDPSSLRFGSQTRLSQQFSAERQRNSHGVTESAEVGYQPMSLF